MAFNNLPAGIQSMIQQGFLQHALYEAMEAKLGFRAIADLEPFPNAIGETVTKTRTGLLPAVTTPMAPAANSDITSGLTPQNFAVEQFIMTLNQYPCTMNLNVVTSGVAIERQFLLNAAKLAENALRSVDTIAQQTLYNTYMGGNTRVRTTLGAPGVAVNVDDIRGFQYTLNASGQVVPVSVSFPVNVVVNANVYSLTGAAADVSNVSTAPGGISGVLTFSGNVTVNDGTALNAAISAVAPIVFRPSSSAANVMATTTAAISRANDINFSKLTMDMILNAKATMSANGVPVVNDSGLYNMYSDPLQLTGLYGDPAFQQFFRGRDQSDEYRKGVVADLLGVRIIETNINPVQNLAGVGLVRRAILCGQGSLIESGYTSAAYKQAEDSPSDSQIAIFDGIAHITREPLDVLQQVVSQSWSYIGGFCVPSDTTSNPTTIPTANNSAFKRAIILESL